jgi:hypothetical protein
MEMGKKKRKSGGLAPWMMRQADIPHAPRRRKKRRNAGFLDGGDKHSIGWTLAQVGAGVGASVGAYWAASKLKMDPKWVALGVAGAGTAAAVGLKNPAARKIGLGAAVGSGTLGGVSLVMEMQAKAKAGHHASAETEKKRQASGEPATRAELSELNDGFTRTRAELQDGLAKTADAIKQSHADLVSVLRAEMARVVDDRLHAYI